MSKGSVGLGLATRRMSVSTSQDRKMGKTSSVFLLLSLSLLLTNFVAADFSKQVQQIAADKMLVVSKFVEGPIKTLDLYKARLQAVWNVQEHNEMLAAENQRLLEWYQTANRLSAENKALRDLLKMKDDDAVTFHGGKVLADAQTQYSHTILVDLGQDHGLTKGQGVLSHEGLIGRVIETGAKTSRVLLMSDVNSRIPVTIDGDGARAILAGTNNGDPVLDHLPDGHTVEAGQKVVTSGHGGIFPYGVPVGETYVTDDGQMAVRPYANPSKANHVQVVDYGVPAGSADRSVASTSSGILR